MNEQEAGKEERSDRAAPPPPTREELGGLQEMLLTAVLEGEVLPGGGRPIVLPDLDFVLEEDGTAVVSEENLLGQPAAGSRVRVLSVEEIRREADQRGELGYLRFQPPEADGESVRCTLEGRVARPGDQEAGLSGVQATFVRSGGEWRLEEEPAYFAA